MFLFGDLLDELQIFFGAQRKKQCFPQEVNTLAAHIGNLYRTVAGLDQTTNIPIDDGPHINNMGCESIQTLVAARLFPGKASTLDQLYRIGAGLSTESFEAGKSTCSGPLSSISLNILHCEHDPSTHTTKESR